jgi:hypothetical protein
MNLLIWGDAENGPCAYFRGSQFRDIWERMGVHTRVADVKAKFQLRDREGNLVPDGPAPGDFPERLKRGDFRLSPEIPLEDISWADVILFRRDYGTHYACSLDAGECAFRTENVEEALKHPHKLQEQHDNVTRPVWSSLLKTTDEIPALVYDTDDYLIGNTKMTWNGLWPDYWAHRELARDMAANADLLTVTTPTLAKLYEGVNPNVRVIRNAIDTRLYFSDAPRKEDPRPLMLYYGSAVRMRDFAGYGDTLGKFKGGFAQKAMLDLKPSLRTMFLGAEPGYGPKVRAYGFDEVRPRVTGIALWAAALATTHADIGIAPLWGDVFDSAKSELHWLEYSVIGAATIADRMDGKGPYSVIRDGVDGFLVKGRQEWYDALRKLAKEKSLREDMAAQARERVVSEYSHEKRAAEWAEAFDWALANKRKR